MPPARRARAEGQLALVAVQVFFGLLPFAVKQALAGFEPATIVAARIGIGALVLGALALGRGGRAALPARRHLPRIALCGLLGVVGNQVLAVNGVQRTTTVDAGLLMTLIPVFTFGLALLVRQERFEARRAVGIAVALGGVLVLQGRALAEADFGGEHLVGNALIVVNTLSYSGYLVLARRLVAERPPLAVIAWVYVASLWSVPWLAAAGGAVADPVPLRAWLALAYLIVFPTVLAYLLNAWALARVRASTTAVYTYLQPLVAGVAGVALLDEQLSPWVLAAAALLFLGIRLVAGGPRPETARGETARGEAPEAGAELPSESAAAPGVRAEPAE